MRKHLKSASPFALCGCVKELAVFPIRFPLAICFCGFPVFVLSMAVAFPWFSNMSAAFFFFAIEDHSGFFFFTQRPFARKGTTANFFFFVFERDTSYVPYAFPGPDWFIFPKWFIAIRLNLPFDEVFFWLGPLSPLWRQHALTHGASNGLWVPPSFLIVPRFAFGDIIFFFHTIFFSLSLFVERC